MNRREYLSSTALMVAAASCGLRVADAAASMPYSTDDFARAWVIDACGGIRVAEPNAQPLRDIRASGVTAINQTVSAVGNGPGKYEETIQQIGYCEREIAAHPDFFLKIHGSGDLKVAKATGRLGVIYGFQDTSMLEGDLARLGQFDDLGVRIIQPTYNRRNLMGDGCLESANGGLSALGHELIAEINRRRILLDLSHAGPRTTAEAISASEFPVAITHTGCRALVDVPRNANDSELKLLADKGGVAGIYFMPFLRASGQPRASDVIRHLEHAVNVCGEDHVGLGTDGSVSGVELSPAYADFQRKFYDTRKQQGIAAPGEAPDVFNLVAEYNDPRRFLTLANDLKGRGWSTGKIEKILGANFMRLFSAVWRNEKGNLMQ
jgi:membrane dipeptidase